MNNDNVYERRNTQPSRDAKAVPTEEQKIRLYGFEQIVQVLLNFDVRYREQILQRLATRDRQLAIDLRNAVLARAR